MISTIFGVFWILFGILCLLKPSFLRGWVARKANRKARWIVLGFLLILTINLIGLIFQFEALAVKILGLVGIALIIRAIWGVQSQARGKFLEWFSGIPLIIFRGVGIAGILMGISLIYFKG